MILNDGKPFLFIKSTIGEDNMSIYAPKEMARKYKVGKRIRFHPAFPAHCSLIMDNKRLVHDELDFERFKYEIIYPNLKDKHLINLEDLFDNRFETMYSDGIVLCYGRVYIANLKVFPAYKISINLIDEYNLNPFSCLKKKFVSKDFKIIDEYKILSEKANHNRVKINTKINKYDYKTKELYKQFTNYDYKPNTIGI